MRVVLIAALVWFAACGGTEAPPEGDYPVAFRVPHGQVDSYEPEHGIAWSRWGNDILLALDAWLRQQDVHLPITDAEPPTYVFTAAESAKLGPQLERLNPPEAALGTFADDFFNTADTPDSGAAMADYLRIVKLAVERTDADHDVVIPVID